jgi:hypothetical protein
LRKSERERQIKVEEILKVERGR